MLDHTNFTPQLFIGIGETHAFFTLRETYLHAVPGPGSYGNAVVNGVYQGSFEVRSYHLRNLSQDADEAFEKATEASHASGMKLTTTRERIQEEMRDIQRAGREEMERRAREQKDREDRWAAERAAQEQQKREMVLSGRFAFGPYAEKPFHEAPRGYLTWLARTLPSFEEGSLIQLTAQEVSRVCADRLLPEPKPDLYLGTPKERRTFSVTVLRCFSFLRGSFNGYGTETVFIVTMVDKDTGACLVSKSPAFSAKEGEELTLKATIKEHSQYREQAQTLIQRIVVLEDAA